MKNNLKETLTWRTAGSITVSVICAVVMVALMWQVAMSKSI